MAEWFTMVLITSDAAEKGSFFIAILLIISVKITVIKSGKSKAFKNYTIDTTAANKVGDSDHDVALHRSNPKLSMQ